MQSRNESKSGQDPRKRVPSPRRTEELRLLIEEYAADLREILKQTRPLSALTWPSTNAEHMLLLEASLKPFQASISVESTPSRRFRTGASTDLKPLDPNYRRLSDSLPTQAWILGR